VCASIIVRLSSLLLLVGVGGGAMNDEERKRLLWLETKVTELLWLAVSAGGAIIGYFTVYVVTTFLIVDAPGWLYLTLFFGTWLVGGYILHRYTFRGAPEHIQYLY
jgi:hypothetical protein